MNPENRIKAKPDEKTIEPEDFLHAAKACFGHLSEGFVIAGYCRKTHRKFIWKITRAKVFDDVLEEIRDPLMTWFDPEEPQTQQKER